MIRILALGILLCGCGAADDATDDGGGDGTPDGGGGQVEATFTSLYGDYLSNCASCHAPGAPGRTSDTEQTLDFSTRGTAYTTITTGMANGLVGNFAGCNDVPFVGATPGTSLLLASLDGPTRTAFDLPAFPDCDMDSIADQTAQVGSAPSADFISALTTWLGDGAADN